MNKNSRYVAIIEPDIVLAKQYKNYLVEQGIVCRWYQTAEKAIMDFDKEAPILIIMELQLPNHSGVELLNELSSYPDFANIPIILLTFIPRVEAALTDKAQNIFNIKQYLYKPLVSLLQLEQAVRNNLVS